MSVALVRAVLDLRDPRLTPTDKFVMLDYAEHANSDTRRAWPSASTVAAETGMGQSTVERSLTRLRKFGYLVKVGKHRVGEHAWVWVYEVQTEVEVPSERGDLDADDPSLRGRGTLDLTSEEPSLRGTNRKGEPSVEPTDTPDGVSAQALVAEWLDHCPTRPGSRVIGQVSRELKILLEDGIAVETVRLGLAEWHRKRLHPSALASVVHTTSLGPADRPSTADQRLASGVALVARLEERERRALPVAQ